MCLICFGSSGRASQPFPFANTPTGCFSPFRSEVSGYDLSSETCISPCRPLVMINISASLQLSLLRRMPKWSLLLLHLDFNSFVMGYVLTFRVIPLGGVALIQVPGLLQGTRGPNSVRLHPWSMTLQEKCGYLLEFDTVYVMVDNRNLAEHTRQDPSLPHWPAAARWWHSRLKLIGPHKEKTELLLFPISATTGLHHVHPTWAGTFVLAALVAVFPGLNFVLLDSDCLPVTLFEGSRIFGRRPFWPGSLLTQMVDSLRHTHCLTSNASAQILVHAASCLQYANALVVTEPHSELNAWTDCDFSILTSLPF